MRAYRSIPPEILKKKYLIVLNNAAKRKALSQKEIALLAGVNQQTVSNVLDGKTRKPKTVERICEALNTPYLSLFKKTAL